MQEIYLPFEEAVEAAARQNFERDKRVRFSGGGQVKQWEEEAEIYREESRFLMEDSGENYFPDYQDHKHIKVLV